jgi:hypothetical protein
MLQQQMSHVSITLNDLISEYNQFELHRKRVNFEMKIWEEWSETIAANSNKQQCFFIVYLMTLSVRQII